MTTAARPTFDPAKGGSGIKESGKISHLVSARDLPGHLTLKKRIPGQDTAEELEGRDFKADLEERERIAQIEKSKDPSCRYVPSLEQATQVRLALKAERDREREAHKEALLNSESINDLNSTNNGPTLIDARKMAQLDKDEDFGSDYNEADFEADDDDALGDDDGDDEGKDGDIGFDDDEFDDDDEDDPDDIQAEILKLQQEKLANQERLEREKEERLRLGATPRSNFDDDASSVFLVKRRWDDDVPFKNCAREGPDPKRKLYVNDTLRQEFHKKFMDKYIR